MPHGGDAVQHGLPFFLFLLFDFFPKFDYILRVLYGFISENVGVTAYHLFGYICRHIFEGESAPFFSDGGVENDLHEQVAQLFAHGVIVAIFGGIHIFSDFAEETFIEAVVSLFPIPGVAIGAAQFFHNLIQLFDLFHLSFSFRFSLYDTTKKAILRTKIKKN